MRRHVLTGKETEATWFQWTIKFVGELWTLIAQNFRTDLKSVAFREIDIIQRGP